MAAVATGVPNMFGISLCWIRCIFPRKSRMVASRRNSSGRFASTALDLTHPRQYSAANALMKKGPLTVVLVFSPTCPHCHTYMPIWERLCAKPGRKANMIRVESGVYEQTPLSEKKEVSMVPTVLFVDKEGRVSEAQAPRDEVSMTNVVKKAPAVPAEQVERAANIVPMTTPSTNQKEEMMPNTNTKGSMTVGLRAATPYPKPGEDIEQLMESISRQVSEQAERKASESRRTSEIQGIKPVIPGTEVSENPLPAQVGGNPWAAFLLAAKHAAPAAALLGAYAALPPKRSSGLSAPTRRRRGGRRYSRRR